MLTTWGLKSCEPDREWMSRLPGHWWQVASGREVMEPERKHRGGEGEERKVDLWWSGDVTVQQRQKARNRDEREESSILCGWERKRRLYFWIGTNHLWCMAGAVITLCYFNNSLIPELSVHYWNATDLQKMRSAAVHMGLYWPFVHTKPAKGIW